MLKKGCTAEFNSKNNNSVLLDLYAQAKVYTKNVDFNLSIYKLDLINAELEVFKNSKTYLS
jgi:hypothetical protein